MRVSLELLHCRSELLGGPVDAAASALADYLRQRADVVDDHGRALCERLEDDDGEDLVGERRDDEGGCPAIQRQQVRGVETSEKAHVVHVCGASAEGVLCVSFTGDQELRIRIDPKAIDQRLDALQLLEPPDEQEVGTLLRRRVAVRRSGARRQEVGEMPDRPGEAPLSVSLRSEAARCEEDVDVLQLLAEEV